MTTMRFLKGAFLSLLIVISTFVIQSFAASGCCSWHGGVDYCDTNVGREVCRDGSYSPSCGCQIIPTATSIPPSPEPTFDPTNEPSNDIGKDFTLKPTLSPSPASNITDTAMDVFHFFDPTGIMSAVAAIIGIVGYQLGKEKKK